MVCAELSCGSRVTLAPRNINTRAERQIGLTGIERNNVINEISDVLVELDQLLFCFETYHTG